MQKLQDSVFSIIKTTNLSPGVFSFLQPSEDFTDKTPLGGILKDTKHGWLALGPKFCVVDLRTGLKVAARTFGAPLSNNHNISVTSVVELPTPLTDNSQQLVISLQCEDSGLICVLHVNGSQLLHCVQTEVVVTEIAVCDRIPDGPFTCFDGLVMAGTKSGEIFAFDLNRASLIQALKDVTQGYEHLIQNESNPTNINFIPYNALHRIIEQRELAVENDDHLAVLLNENSLVDGQYIFRNPDGSVRMKAKRDHIRVTVLQYIPELGSLAVGYNFGAFQIWNMMTLELEFTSQVNVDCLPVTHFGFQEPCDDPRAFCYLWVVFSVTDRFQEEEFPLGVLYSLTYQGKRMLSDTKYLYQEFSTATIRFQLELGATDESPLLGGKCVSCHTYSVNSTLADEGEENMLNICQIVWECWGESANTPSQYGMLLFDLDQWYKDQMPATWRLESNAFLSVTWCAELARGALALDVRLAAGAVAAYSHATRLDEHFYPNSLQYNCICLNTSDACVLSTVGIQRQILSSLDEVGPTALLNPPRLYHASVAAGLAPLLADTYCTDITQEEQRRFLLSMALEARLTRFLKRCAHDWATGSHSGAGCTLQFLVDWCWQRALELKEHAKELTAPLFTSPALPDRNVVRCLEHCVQQLTQLTGLLDSVLTKCCNLVVPDALSEIEEKYKGLGTVSLYFQVVQWLVRGGLLPEPHPRLPYPARHLAALYNNRRLKLNRLRDNSPPDEDGGSKSCPLLYIDQLIEHEFGGDRIHQMWVSGGSENGGLYPPPSLYALLRLYLLPDVADEHKHSLVLYLLVDYSMVYDEVRYEAVIRRLMQFPTMFGLSNTAIKATQAFWHLDHRDFDFALDQLQCLTGNTLSEWQHNVVLSSLLAQKKSQAALQYLHVRAPAPGGDVTRRPRDWRARCGLLLAHGLLCEAADVLRLRAHHAATAEDKAEVWNYFYTGCRNSGNLSKILQLTLQPFEEEVFVKYLESCDEPHTSDILIMYYLQQARYLEAERCNSKLRQRRPRGLDGSASAAAEAAASAAARADILQVLCCALPPIAGAVARCAFSAADVEPHVIAPKPMSVFVKAKSPKNTFTYKSSFIQDTIENASETWMNRPKMRRGLKRALNIEDTPFICTPKLSKTRSVFSPSQPSEATPAKRAKLDLSDSPRTPGAGPGPGAEGCARLSPALRRQLAQLLDMPAAAARALSDRSGAGTPHSILKIRRHEGMCREAVSPVDSRYLGDSDDELLETASSHTHYSDSTNKHLRFTIPHPSEGGSTPSPRAATPAASLHSEPAAEREQSLSAFAEKDTDVSTDSFITTTSHAMNEPHPLESPPKKQATGENFVKPRKSFKDNVRARRSLSISANSSLSEDPNTSIESIADIPITLINPRYSGEKRPPQPQPQSQPHTQPQPQPHTQPHTQPQPQPQPQPRDHHSYTELHADTLTEMEDDRSASGRETADVRIEVPKTPKGRRGIRVGGESTPLMNRSRSVTPERHDSPVVTPLRSGRRNRSRSRTPELSPRSSPLAPIPEQPAQETQTEPHPEQNTLTVPRQLRSRSRTPERIDKGVAGSPRLEAIKESPTKSSDTESSSSSPSRRGLRSRSRTPEVVEVTQDESIKPSPRGLRSRSKTPEKLISSKMEHSARGKKSLSRLVLEANTFAKTKQTLENLEAETTEQLQTTQQTDSVLECTPMKTLKQVPSLMDVTLSPIVNKSVLLSSTDSTMTDALEKDLKTDKSAAESVKSLPAFTTIHETYVEKSVLQSYDSCVGETSQSIREEKVEVVKIIESNVLKPLPAFTLNDTELEKSVLHSYESSVAETSSMQEDRTEKSLSKPFAAFAAMINNDFQKSVLRSCESSVAEMSNENVTESGNVSSLITNDSDVEMQEADTAAVIQKEKERIVEIEREIREIEGDMSDEERGSVSSGDEEIIEEDDDSDDSDTSNETSSSSSSGDEEIITIQDTDSDDSSSDNKLQIDEQSSDGKGSQPEDQKIVQVDVQRPEDKRRELEIEKAAEITEPTESSTDPLNHGQFSILTDDNSFEVSDKSDLNLNYSDEQVQDGADVVGGKADEPMQTDPQLPVEIEVIVEVAPTEITPEVRSIHKDVPKAVDVTDSAGSKDIPEAKNFDSNIDKIETVSIISKESTQIVPKEVNAIKKVDNKVLSVEETKSTHEDTEKSSKQLQETAGVSKETEMVVDKETTQQVSEVATEIEPHILEEPTVTTEAKPRTRKRVKSTSSNKSTIDTEETEPKTPVTRKRTQSNASNKSIDIEQKTPENDNTEVTTPSRRRAKTPTSAEVRKIITRRVSREMSEKLDDSKLLDESALTPKRRSARSRSKNIDDNESVASESSVVSGRSRASEDTGDRPARKGKKSVLASKPELSVIPEVIAEDASKGDSENLITEYSSSRRLTRNQKAVLESWLEPTPRSPAGGAGAGAGRARRASTASRTSRASRSALSDADDDDASSTHSAFDVQPIDRISLLNKTDFEGSPDTDELRVNMSPESIASDASKQRRSRVGRAASESKSTPRAAKIGRRVSTDIGEAGSPERGAASPARGRRASFNRACEALHTPKGRRTSTDLRKGDTESPIESPAASEADAPASAGRRGRRASATSTSQSDAGKRSKRMPSIDDNKDKKK